MKEVTLKFLGTGTSHAIPMIGCKCETCTSADPKDTRTNSSLLIQKEGENIIIDCGKDFRNQAINADIDNLSAVLLTHNHSDHVSGIDDLRVFNRLQNKPVPIFGKADHLETLKNYTFHYLFSDETQKGGGIADLQMNSIKNNVEIEGIDFEVLDVIHGKIEIFGYKFLNCAYISDVSCIPEKTLAKIRDLDILIIDALRFREHSTHFNIRQALNIVEAVKPKKTYFTHICHDIMHSKVDPLFKDKKSEYFTEHDVSLAYDGLEIKVMKH